MQRFCYCSKILPGKTPHVQEHWKKKVKTAGSADESDFWNALQMTGFESWLQKTPQGDFMIHCLEGKSLQTIFKGLREQIKAQNSIALKLQAFYLDVLGKDYQLQETEPKIEFLTDISLPTKTNFIKRAFFFPLLPHKESAHRKFREEVMSSKKARHEASMSAFGVSRLSTWLQSTPQGKYIVVYTERHAGTPSDPSSRLKQGEGSSAWQEISQELMDHTGLDYSSLSPNVEWLTQP